MVVIDSKRLYTIFTMKTGRPAYIIRNEAIVLLHKLRPAYFTLYKLAQIFKLKRQTVQNIYHRDNKKYDL